WRAIFARDPRNFAQRLVLFRVEDCQPTGLLWLLAYTDLTPILNNPTLLREVVLNRLNPAAQEGAPPPISRYTPPPTTAVPREVRTTPNFAGRQEEVAAIGRHLRPGKPVVLIGFGGVGKTTLAREAALRHKDRFAGIWHIDGSSEEAIQLGFITLGDQFVN